MKKALLLVTCFVGAFSLAHSQAEKKVEVEILVRKIMGSPEWVDNVSLHGNGARVQLPYSQYDDLFNDPTPTNYTGVAWTPEERKAAFEEFVSNIPELSTNGYYRGIGILAPVALGYCTSHRQTNVLGSVMRILASKTSVAHSTALQAFEQLAAPNEEINAFVVNMMTNNQLVAASERGYFLDAYIRMLKNRRTEFHPNEFTNGVAVVLSAVKDSDSSIALDRFLKDAYPDYEVSSNRFAIALRSLSNSNALDEDYVHRVQEYFTHITNQLINAGQPLPEVEALRGL